MPSPAGTVAKAVAKNAPRIGKFLIKYGPITFTVVSKFLKDHPTLPDWAKARLTEVADRVKAVQQRRGPAAQIQGKLEIVRDEVARMEDLPAEVRSGWTKRAGNIEHATHLAAKLGKPEQRKALTRLMTEADVLLAEVIDAIAYVPPEAPAA